MSSQTAVILAAARSPVGKADRGALRNMRPDDMAAQVIQALLKRVQPLSGDQIDDVILGCAFPEAEQGMNLARITAQLAGLPDSVSAMTINRFCASGLQAIALASQSIESGSNNAVIAGGAESMSLIPMEGNNFLPNPTLVKKDPDVYLSMGLTAELVIEKFGVTRQRQDEFALASHQKALGAQKEGAFDAETVPLTAPSNGGDAVLFEADEGPRSDTSLAALASLPPVFKAGGTVTAGNSSQRSDGAAVSIVLSQGKARELGLKPLGRLVAYATAGVPPEVMGIGPVHAIPKALKQADLRLQDIDLIELNEAFAGQALAVMDQAGLNPDIVNVKGGAVALGHPLGCTGAKLTATLLHELRRRGKRYGMVTMCVGGGMGAAGIFENYRV